jgi:hypothetical protein
MYTITLATTESRPFLSNRPKRALRFKDDRIAELETQLRLEVARRETAKLDADTARTVAEQTLASFRRVKDAQLHAESAEKVTALELAAARTVQTELLGTVAGKEEQIQAMGNAVWEAESRASQALAARNLSIRVIEKKETENSILAQQLGNGNIYIIYI